MIQRCPLASRGLLALSGKDALSFLQGYATCDLANLQPAPPAASQEAGQPQARLQSDATRALANSQPASPAVSQDAGRPQSTALAGATGSQALLGAICNIKGRMVTSFLVVRAGEELLLRMHRPLVQRTMDFLAKYIVFAKAEMRDASAEWRLYAEPGTHTTPPAEGECANATSVGGWGGKDTATNQPILKVQLQDKQITIDLGYGRELWSREPLAAKAPEIAWDDLEVAQGIAWVQEATSEQFLPQMFNYHELAGVDFAKGCYLGQEVVARAQYRGQLKRRLQAVEAAGLKTGDSFDGGQVVAAGRRQALVVRSDGS